MFYQINEETLNNLPIHDAEINNVKFVQNENGNTDLLIDVKFDVDEVKELEKEISSNIDSSGCAKIMFKGCKEIGISYHCNNSNRDRFDYWEFVDKMNGNRMVKSLKIYLTSGSNIECITETGKMYPA